MEKGGFIRRFPQKRSISGVLTGSNEKVFSQKRQLLQERESSFGERSRKNEGRRLKGGLLNGGEMVSPVGRR